MIRTNDLLKERGEDFRFPVNFGDGIIHDYRHTWGRKEHVARLKSHVRVDRPRQAYARITTFLGSLGAVHHYARINLGYWRYTYLNGKPFRRVVNDSGLFDETPFGFLRVDLEVMRQVEARDLKHDREQARFDRLIYGRMKRGDWTHGFWSEAEASEAAAKFFKAHFAPGWVLVSEDGQSVAVT